MKDRLTPELRKTEEEVDLYYRYNPLMNLPFATAAWSMLAFAEDRMLQDSSASTTFQDITMIVDNLVNEMKHPICWIYRACKQGGQVPFTDNYQVDRYRVDRSSRNLFKLGRKYGWFVAAYTYASRGWIELDLQGSMIQPTENLFTGIEYEAYSRLIKPHESQEALSSVNLDNLPIDAIVYSLRIKGERFSYKTNPRLVCDTIKALTRPIFDKVFSLPSEWQFSHYSLGDFHKVFETIAAMAYIHLTARRIAVDLGCLDMGYADSIYVCSFDDLLRQVARYSGVSNAKVRSIFDDLVYGNKGILHPDPVLQPLIKLNSEAYAIMPHLWICSSAERNLTVLLNKLPCEKEIYAKLVDEKEELMRRRFITGLSDKGFRFIWGNVLDLPDVDLAIIRDSEKACLLLELKWFIAPAEVREIIEKSEEIKKGICQVLQMKRAFTNSRKPLLEKLQIDSSYSFKGVVVSENWIGHNQVQSTEIPVIRADHLIAKLKMTESLESAMEWLRERKYLPKEGEHFKVHRMTATISNWSMKWYGIQPLIDDAFFPL